MRRPLLGAPLLFAPVLASCGKSNQGANTDAGLGGVDGNVFPDAGSLTACLDQPGEPPGLPNGTLPCELIPPGGLR